jgi:hypothetical protein
MAHPLGGTTIHRIVVYIRLAHVPHAIALFYQRTLQAIPPLAAVLGRIEREILQHDPLAIEKLAPP